MRYKYIAIIPARKNSKRLPLKNIMQIHGLPLLAYSIKYARSFKFIDHVFVSTDDLIDISLIAKSFNSEVIKRPDELASDTAPTSLVLQHAVKYLLKKNIVFDYVVLLQPTNPFRTNKLLLDCINIIETGKFDSLISVSPINLKIGEIENNSFKPLNYFFGQRSQDLNKLYFENGLLYISHKNLLEKGDIIGENMYAYIYDHFFGQIDIDTKNEFDFAECIYEKYKDELKFL